MDLSALPTRIVLRWDLAVRIILGPLLLQVWITGEVLGTALVTGLVAAVVSLSSLGPEVARPGWIAVAAVVAPWPSRSATSWAAEPSPRPCSRRCR